MGVAIGVFGFLVFVVIVATIIDIGLVQPERHNDGSKEVSHG